MSKRVTFIPDDSYRHDAGTKDCGKKKKTEKKMIETSSFSMILPKSSGYSAVRFLQRIGAKVARLLGLTSYNMGRSSGKVSSSSASLARSRSYAPTLVDSHRAEAIDDCIEFLNSSSSLSSLRRSNSVSS